MIYIPFGCRYSLDERRGGQTIETQFATFIKKMSRQGALKLCCSSAMISMKWFECTYKAIPKKNEKISQFFSHVSDKFLFFGGKI